MKFVIGALMAGASYIMMGIIGNIYGNAHFSVNWVILSYIICVVGELCLSPTGNSAAVKLAPKAFNAQMMSLWLLTNASAQAFNGTLVKLIDPLGQTNYFIFLGVTTAVITFIILAFSPKIIKSDERHSLIVSLATSRLFSTCGFYFIIVIISNYLLLLLEKG